jgi:transcriptional regulator with XRE-family HTH domain
MAVSRREVARLVGAELSALRQGLGLSLRDVERETGIGNSTVSMYEKGHRLPGEDSLDVLLNHYGATAEKREALASLVREAEGPGRVLPGVPGSGDALADLISAERQAVRITDMAPLLIPGLLQTSDYSLAILGDDTSATLRAGRSEILTRKRNPVEYFALIDSEVLVRPIASAAVMRDQLDHLLRLGELANVHIHVWRSTRRGWHAGLTGPFVLLEFGAGRSPIVHVEHHRASLALWEREDVLAYVDAAESVRREVAMTEDESATVIADIAHGMESA